MRLTSSLAYTRAVAVPKMPPGLVELMEGMTKEVLKNNPSNVYEFCVNHFEKLLEMRDGPSPGKSLTLEEKIAKAQEKVRQRAQERQQHYDNEVQRNVKHEGPENVDSGEGQNTTEKEFNLRAPVHHDQELSLSSEVEISHEPTDNNSLTSKDSNFDESDEIPISKSSTFSSVSKSTVIDLMAGNDDRDDAIENIEIPKIEINNDEQLEEREVVNAQNNENAKDEDIEILKMEINKDKTVKESMIVESAYDDNVIIQNNIEPPALEEDSAVLMPDEYNFGKNPDNTLELLPSDFVKSDIGSVFEVNLKSLDEVNIIIEEDENIVNEIEPSNDPIAEIETGISVEKLQNDIEDSVIKNFDDTITKDSPNESVSTPNVEEKFENNQVTDITAESLNETTPPESVGDSANIFTDHTNDSNPNESSTQIEKQNDRVHVSDVEVNKETTPSLDSMKSNESSMNIGNESEGINLDTDDDEKKEVFENKGTEANTLLDLKHNPDDGIASEEKHSLMFSEDKEKVSKEDNANSSSTSFQRSGSADDSSVIGSDLSKAEEDINRSDNENGQNNMNLETAAETIQKVFRSFLFKSRNSTFEDITNDEETSLEEDNDKNKEEYYATAKERRPLGITRMDTVLQTVNEEKSLSLSTDDSSTLSSAATTIQAHVRGFLVRNRLNSYKTVSTNSLVNSNEMLDTDTEQQKNKTVLNIHIVPEEGNYLSRDESLITSMDLSLDESPPSSINLHPLSYDLVSERRKLLKREDAIQSVSPPSNNSGKLSEDSVKEVLNETDTSKIESNNEKDQSNPENNSPETMVTATNEVTVRDTSNEQEDTVIANEKRKRSMSSDESDVVTPFVASPRSLVGDFENTSKLVHSGEFHDVVLPTKVSRSDTTVVSEFKNVLAYILLWNNS